jgi:hypothetical protein
MGVLVRQGEFRVVGGEGRGRSAGRFDVGRRMRSTSLFCCAICYSGGARVTAWQRVGHEDVSPAAQPSPSLLIGGARAPFTRTTRLPSADELFVGMFSVARDIDLPIA